ncbi:splicing regulator RBM11 isoform X2 [Hetaerina americana]|uniref:splicing regulator RBM11 isoform X2 n=1 Tax=Hetaerina americana TaxID=62018 RepID=UPI003A7F2FB2
MDEKGRTLWCGNLSEKVTEAILYELFLQGGPLEKVLIPKDRDGNPRRFGFIVYKHPCSVPYAAALFQGTALYRRKLNLQYKQSVLEIQMGD